MASSSSLLDYSIVNKFWFFESLKRIPIPSNLKNLGNIFVAWVIKSESERVLQIEDET